MSQQTYLTACPMDCPDTCSLRVEVKDGKITSIGASELNPDTQGFICSKISHFARRVYSSERVHYPLRRTGEKGKGEFERISWETAAEIICERFRRIKQEWGGEAILPFSYGGSNAMLGQDTVDRAFFARLGASRLARVVCAAPTTEAALGMYGKMPGTAFEDYQHAKFILIWGANPKASNIHLVPYLKKARGRGAKIAVVDPRRNFSENECDLHLPVYPGTDVVVALAMIDLWRRQELLNWDFIKQHTKGAEVLLKQAEAWPVARAAEVARVDEAAIVALAEMYALHDPAVIRVGWGLERNRNGGQSVAAVLALPAVLGKFGLRGSGYTLSNSAAYKLDLRDLVVAPSWRTRVINMNRLGRVLLKEDAPPVKALFVYNCNPVVTIPDQKAVIAGLSRSDLFTVVSEQVMTDTARFADIVLPAVTFLEQREIKKGYGSYALQYMEKVVEPLGEARPNEEMFALLGRTMGWNDPAFAETTDDYLRRAARSIHGMGRPVEVAELQADHIRFFDFPGRTPVQFKTVFPWTPDGRINLAPGNLGERPYVFTPEPETPYPLALISPASGKLISSTLGEFNLPELHVTLNPTDALPRDIKNGDLVRVFNHLGEVQLSARLSD
ncbi:MAG: molybdopterin oxidoreductase family protein, partial [Calditrichaeota bacterium]